MCLWITIEAERVLYVQSGRDVILCDNHHHGSVTLVLKLSDAVADQFARTIMNDRTETGTLVIMCKGPPLCLLRDDEAVANQLAGCPQCRRIVVHSDGTETEFQEKPN